MNGQQASEASVWHRWGRGVAALLALALFFGCGGRKVLSGKDVSLDARETAAITELVTKAAGLVAQGKEQQVFTLMKQQLPKAEQAAVMAVLKKLSRAPSWKVEQVSRFSPTYFRAVVSLEGGPVKSVTINLLRQDDGFVLTGGG